ncbi:DUF6624 domain-containing protein [Stackebrandtia nassauensis]|uniref:Lantibiotic biosynthesis protein dehydration domain-containing protein n=1 Tax=Stackebrandtia nassauensis (strain DSM 44728 / CIP 108903 / NRRL B-16338 / NBRC 102104 / LLR-40K-21) TaxID=446470 RepID=D3Q4V7_STANL|nr:DUF6624 domain-containing protein [Stackebrandtia nassauensis]ADD42137.1 hypothetical protein Snas_2454 [Stackebrandtia nassauensis DSM 44728]
MDNLSWRPAPGSANPLGATANQVVEAVSHGRRGGLFPPVAAEVGTHVSQVRRLSGEADATVLAAALSAPAFAPLVDALDAATRWCERAGARNADVIDPEVLSLDNDGLFGAVFTELFTVCAADRLPDLDAFCRRRIADWLTHLDVFLARLCTEWRGDLDRYFGASGRIVELTAHGDETHNAGRRVLRLVSADGTAVAYKARPACGEALFLTADTGGEVPDSVFALLNRLTNRPEIELPTLRCQRRGEGVDSRLWQEWIEAAPRRPIHREHGLTVSGPVVAESDCPELWSRAGALVAAAMAFGIADLIDGNLLAGRRAGETGTRHYIVDVEVFGRPVDHLFQTGLTAESGPHHHVGFENRPRLCGVDALPVCFRQTDEGLELVRSRRSWARSVTDTVVSDAAGRFGYGPYLPHFVRGAFDLWAVLCRDRDEIGAFAREHRDGVFARVLPRDTGDYYTTLADRLLANAPLPSDLAESERGQLDAGDVPYYFAAIGDDRMSTIDGPVDDPKLTDDQLATEWPPVADWDLGGLGMTLRGALDYAATPALPRAAGVRVGASEVAVDWPEFDARLIYSWDAETNRVKVAELTEPEPLDEIAERLCRIDDADAVLRSSWVDGGRSDTELEAQLSELGAEAIAWLETVVDEHGWPTAEMVGTEAAAGAVRLLQHVDGALEFRRRCLRELEAAALDGRAELPDVAYVTDSLCLAEGVPQRYGTKFERRDGELVPCPLADPEGVDAARAAMGLSSLDEYTRRIRDRFDPATPTRQPQ